jgi:hypothetical protein
MTACMGKVAVDGGKQAAAVRDVWRAPSQSCAPDPYLLTLLTRCNLSKSPRSCEREAVYLRLRLPWGLGERGATGAGLDFGVTPDQGCGIVPI